MKLTCSMRNGHALLCEQFSLTRNCFNWQKTFHVFATCSTFQKCTSEKGGKRVKRAIFISLNQRAKLSMCALSWVKWPVIDAYIPDHKQLSETFGKIHWFLCFNFTFWCLETYVFHFSLFTLFSSFSTCFHLYKWKKCEKVFGRVADETATCWLGKQLPTPTTPTGCRKHSEMTVVMAKRWNPRCS